MYKKLGGGQDRKARYIDTPRVYSTSLYSICLKTTDFAWIFNHVQNVYI